MDLRSEVACRAAQPGSGPVPAADKWLHSLAICERWLNPILMKMNPNLMKTKPDFMKTNPNLMKKTILICGERWNGVLFQWVLRVVVVLSAQLAAPAGTYYVDFANGNDANNGTAPGTPWQHCPGDTAATGVPSTSVFIPGDTVIFKGGVSYTNTVNLNWSGTAGQPITYDGNSAQTFGSGQAVFDGMNGMAGANVYCFYATGQGYLNFNNFEIRNLGVQDPSLFNCANQPVPSNPAGMYFVNCSNLLIANSYCHDIGNWTNVANIDGSIMNGAGIVIKSSGVGWAGAYGSASSCVISSCQFSHIGGSGIYVGALGSVTNLRILNCSVHDYVRWGIDINPSANNIQVSDIIIDGFQMYNYYQLAPDTWAGCPFTNPHEDAIVLNVGNTGSVTNVTFGTAAQPVIIRNSSFYNNTASQVNAGTACIFLSTWGGTLWIYNNVFINVLNSGEGAIFSENGVPLSYTNQPDYLICNNTFLDNSHIAIDFTEDSAPLTNGTVRVLNNIIYDVNTGSGGGYPMEWGQDGGISVPTECDHNLHYTLRSDHLVASVCNATSTGRNFSTFSQYQALGFDLHGLLADPAFANITFGVGANSSANDLHLTSGSPAIFLGTNLSAFFTTDKDGNPRPSSGYWDAGAYQHGAGQSAPVPAAPKNLRVVPPTGVAVVYSGSYGVTNGMVAWWPFDDLTGADGSGNGNTMSFYNSATNVPGEINGGLSLSPANSYGDAGQMAPLSGATAATLTGWIYRSASSINAGFGEWQPSYRFDFVWYSDGNVYVSAENGGLSYPSFTPSSETGWNFIAIVYNGGASGLNNILQVYWDAALQTLKAGGASPAASLASGSNQSSFRIGYDGSNGYEPGIYDDVRIYNRALSAAEVASQYNWP